MGWEKRHSVKKGNISQLALRVARIEFGPGRVNRAQTRLRDSAIEIELDHRQGQDQPHDSDHRKLSPAAEKLSAIKEGQGRDEDGERGEDGDPDGVGIGSETEGQPGQNGGETPRARGPKEPA